MNIFSWIYEFFFSKVSHGFEDPEGKVELPRSLRVEQWKRPIEFLPADKVDENKTSIFKNTAIF